MPYTIADGREEFVMELWNSEFYQVQKVQDLLRDLGTCDYSVVESRRAAHRNINEFRDDAKNAPFEHGTRFPQGWHHLYLSSHESVVIHTIQALQAVLSYRLGNVAKDTSTVTDSKGAGGRGDKEVIIAFDQGLQDNTKRFEELQKSLAELCNNKGKLWHRSKFELEAGATWT